MSDDFWPLLLSCLADCEAGATTLPEFCAHRERRTRLAVLAGAYAHRRGYPLVVVNGWEIGGADAWCSFIFGCQDPRFVAEALLEIDSQ